MAKSEILPEDAPGDRRALEFMEGTITLEALNHWAPAYVRDTPEGANRHSPGPQSGLCCPARGVEGAVGVVTTRLPVC